MLLFVLPSRMFSQGKCVSGSGTCSDAFTGTAGTSLSIYDASWVKIKGTSDVVTTGSGTVAIDGRNYAYYGYALSTSDVSQITVKASNTTGAYTRSACVRLTPNFGGYCVGFGSVVSGNYYNCYVEKGGSSIGNGNCGLISATVDHTLAIVASGSSSTNLNIYVDGVRTGSLTDTNQPLTTAKSGFSLIGDGTTANSQADGWQDYQGSIAIAAPEAISAAAPPNGCPSGSGSCYDTFAGSAGQPLAQYNSTWVRAKGTSDAYLTGTKSVQIPGVNYVYYYYDSSSSDISQILVSPSVGKQSYAREACVRMQKNVGGYCVGFGGVVNGNYNNCYIEKGGLYLGAANCGTIPSNVPHTLAVVASGSYPVVLQVYVDGIPMRAITDVMGVYQKARSGFGLLGDGDAVNSDAGTWRDYREVVVATAPSFSPEAGAYSSAQNIVLSSPATGAVLRYTTDGSTPTAISPVYTGPMKISASTTMKAISMVAGQSPSPVATAVYQISLPPVATPTFTIPSPYSGIATQVGILNNASGAQLLYCLDTTNTCTPSVPYFAPINFASSIYIRAQALLAGYTPSAIASWQGTWSTVQITTASCPEGTQYKAYAGCTLTASGGLPPYIYNWSKTSGNGLVEGLNLDPLTGRITGTVYGQGVYSVPFTVTDGTNTTVTKVVTMPMRGDNTLGGCSLFPADSIWHLNVANLPVDTSPAAPIYSAYLNATLHLVFGPNLWDGGIPFMRVPWNQQYVPVSTTLFQSYFTSGPFPSYATVEGTQNSGADADRHVSIIQTAGGGNHCKLWEMFQGSPTNNGWTDSSNAYWDLESYDMLPQDNGSTDAAGLPIAPLLWNYDEVAGGCAKGAECGVVKHAGRLTLNHTMNYHVWPATAQSGLGYCTGGFQNYDKLLSQTDPPTFCSGSGVMGEIYRLKSTATTPAACMGHPQAQVLVTAMRNYGLMLVDNGYTGGVVATPDTRWDTDDLACLTAIKLSDFEPVNVSSKMIDLNSSKVRP